MAGTCVYIRASDHRVMVANALSRAMGVRVGLRLEEGGYPAPAAEMICKAVTWVVENRRALTIQRPLPGGLEGEGRMGQARYIPHLLAGTVLGVFAEWRALTADEFAQEPTPQIGVLSPAG